MKPRLPDSVGDGAGALVKRSHEQLMLNPLVRRLRDLNPEIARPEEHVGMTHPARLRLGVTYLQEQAAKRERRRPHPMVE